MRSIYAVRGETDFFRRQNNQFLKKEKKLKTIKLRGIHLAVILFLLTLIAFFIYKTGQFILTWDKLNIKSYKLINSPVERMAEVKAVLNNNKGNILALNVKNLRAQLLRIPIVEDVAVSRILPTTVQVRFTLRQPAFQVATNNGYQVIDQQGKILYHNPEPKWNLITLKNIKPGLPLEKTIALYPQLATIKNSIEYIGFTPPYGTILKLKGVKEIFYTGEVDFIKKINYYLKLRKDFSVDIEKIKNVDLRFADRFYLEFEEEVSPQNETE